MRIESKPRVDFFARFKELSFFRFFVFSFFRVFSLFALRTATTGAAVRVNARVETGREQRDAKRKPGLRHRATRTAVARRSSLTWRRRLILHESRRFLPPANCGDEFVDVDGFRLFERSPWRPAQSTAGGKQEIRRGENRTARKWRPSFRRGDTGGFVRPLGRGGQSLGGGGRIVLRHLTLLNNACYFAHARQCFSNRTLEPVQMVSISKLRGITRYLCRTFKVSKYQLIGVARYLKSRCDTYRDTWVTIRITILHWCLD